MNIELNKDLIRTSNNQSMYNRGDHIQEDANKEYKKFLDKYKDKEFNSSQLEIFNKRKEQFKDLITSCYNEYLSVSSQFVPITVAGPSKYPTDKMGKLQDRMVNKIDEIDDKINKFYKNTDDMLKNAYTKEEIIECLFKNDIELGNNFITECQKKENEYFEKRTDANKKPQDNDACSLNGWGSWIRTNACWIQRPVPYRLAIPQWTFLL